jgi:hypothetical protein
MQTSLAAAQLTSVRKVTAREVRGQLNNKSYSKRSERSVEQQELQQEK